MAERGKTSTAELSPSPALGGDVAAPCCRSRGPNPAGRSAHAREWARAGVAGGRRRQSWSWNRGGQLRWLQQGEFKEWRSPGMSREDGVAAQEGGGRCRRSRRGCRSGCAFRVLTWPAGMFSNRVVRKWHLWETSEAMGLDLGAKPQAFLLAEQNSEEHQPPAQWEETCFLLLS